MKFDFESYLNKQNKEDNTTNNDQIGTKVSFLNQYLKNDGDVVIVRFPYETINDFDVETCHLVNMPGYKYAQKVICSKTDEDPKDACPLCAKNEKRVKRFLVKALAYIQEGSELKIVPVVWDRPFAYAQELASKFKDYGGLKQHLFKIKRTGSGAATTYSTDIIVNNAIYKPEIYVSKFELLEKVNPVKIIIKSYDKYLAAFKEKTEDINSKLESVSLMTSDSTNVVTDTENKTRTYKI